MRWAGFAQTCEGLTGLLDPQLLTASNLKSIHVMKRVFCLSFDWTIIFLLRLTMYQVCIQATSGARVDVEFVAGALSCGNDFAAHWQ